MQWLENGDHDSGSGMIMLPTRRAGRALMEAFLRRMGGRVLLLPRILAMNGLDEGPLALANNLNLPPAVEPMRRLAVLSQLILAAGRNLGIAPFADQAWLLANSLAELMDEADLAEIDLAAKLPGLAENHATHWSKTLRFLEIVTHAWPNWLAENRLMNPAARRAALLRAQASAWDEHPPDTRIWAAGFTAANPALLALLASVARLPRGCVVLPDLDCDPDRTIFEGLPDTHPQAGISALLQGLGVQREDVTRWGEHPGCGAPIVPEGRVRALRTALLPAQALGSWLEESRSAGLDGVSRLSAADQQEEAAAVALVLRDAIDKPGRRAALVTPDRALASRVVVELARFGVLADDSAGELLAATPPAALLRLLIHACESGLSPVFLLALLKHPFVGAGHSVGECRRLARVLERTCLRGPAPKPGVDGLRRALALAQSGRRSAPADAADLIEFLDVLERALQPLTAVFAVRGELPVPRLLEAVVFSAEALASTDSEDGAERLWSREDGNALAEHLAAFLVHAADLPPQPAQVLGRLLNASMGGIAVRSRRGLRGHGTREEHPRVFIWGLLEARLQSVEVVVLGGLVEGVWPEACDPGPWMSRPMRVQAGLPSPEQRIGQAAQDFMAAVCCSPEVVLSYPRSREGAPAVPARWLVRLDAWLRGQHRALPVHAAVTWLRRLDQPEKAPRPVRPPAPQPPVGMRPRRLSITEIETWMRDPYAVHARHILRLSPLRPLEEAADALDYGLIAHRALQSFVDEHGATWPEGAAVLLQAAFLHALEAAELRPGLAAWWRPRLLRIAHWVAHVEAERRSMLLPLRIGTEVSGSAILSGLPGGEFVLHGRADRIEANIDGTVSMIDYKTGTLPAVSAVKEGWASQIVLEAAIARIGGFGPEFVGEIGRLAYWRLSGGQPPGEIRVPLQDVGDVQDLVARCWSALGELVAAYDYPQQPYLSQPRPDHAPRFTDYANLARVAEWSAAREEGT